MDDKKLEQLEIATLLSRGGQLSRDIKDAYEDFSEDSNGIDQDDAAALADIFLRLRLLLITTREDREAMESTESI
jgi:hypothetical protein